MKTWSQHNQRGPELQGEIGRGKEGGLKLDPQGNLGTQPWVLPAQAPPSQERATPGGRNGCCSPAVAILDANVATAVELLAILKPAVGRLGVTGCCLALERLLLPNLSCLTLHLLQLGPGGCGGTRQGGEHGGGGRAASGMSSGRKTIVLGPGLGSAGVSVGSSPPCAVS